MASNVRRLAYCAEGSHFVLLEHAVEVGTRLGPDLIEYPVYLCEACAEELEQQIERDRKHAQEEAEMAMLASWRADQANSYLRSTNAHSMRTTRLYWAWLDTLRGKQPDDGMIDLPYEHTEQPTVKLAGGEAGTAKLAVIHVEGETHR